MKVALHENKSEKGGIVSLATSSLILAVEIHFWKMKTQNKMILFKKRVLNRLSKCLKL